MSLERKKKRERNLKLRVWKGVGGGGSDGGDDDDDL